MTKTVKQIVTVKLPLKDPSLRKQERMLEAIKRAGKIARTADERMFSIPTKKWRVQAPGNSWWWRWAKQLAHEVDLPSEAAHQTIQNIRETYNSWRSNGYSGNRPFSSPVAVRNSATGKKIEKKKIEMWNRVGFRGGGRQAKISRAGQDYFLSIPLAAGRGQRESVPLNTSGYSRQYLEDIENGFAKQADGCELIAKDLDWSNGEPVLTDATTWWFHQPVAYEREVPELDELDSIVAVKLARYRLVSAAVYPVSDGVVATDPERIVFPEPSGKQVEHYRKQQREERKRKMERGNLRGVKAVRRREAWCVDGWTHGIANDVVEVAKEASGATGIVLEDLTHVRRFMEDEMRGDNVVVSSWPFREQGGRIRYKALLQHVSVFDVSPVMDSRWCSRCGEKAEEEGKRHWRPDFRCRNPGCGYEVSPRYVNSTRILSQKFMEKYLST